MRWEQLHCKNNMSAMKIPVTGLTSAVEAMVQTEGVYLAGDTKHPGTMVAMVSLRGKIFMLKPDAQLDPFRFLPTMTLNGPYLPPEPNGL